MAFAGLKKQINKANQYMNEKIGGAEGTKLDDDFVEMEKKTDSMLELIDELQVKTREYLQPNPTVRSKMVNMNGVSKLSGQVKVSAYPQPEGVLGECMTLYGRKLGEDSLFAASLVETGESMKLMADVKYSLDDNVTQYFLDPLLELQNKDLKEVMHHRKKLQGRRLDFDCKRRRQTKVGTKSAVGTMDSVSPYQSPRHCSRECSSDPDDDFKQSEEKFAESLHLAQTGMNNLLQNDAEQVSQLVTFAECLLGYHKQCTEILNNLLETLNQKKEEAATRPKPDIVPRTALDLRHHLDNTHQNTDLQHLRETYNNDSMIPTPNMLASLASATLPHDPTCQALYDFDAENQGELSFKEGDIIRLSTRIDENWYEGTLNGRSGYFPVTYVQIIVPLPS
ncbi:unnamed protein product [Allacma fusca]|uniref:Endophilin-A n=1 Tax=Allacma fusca TaxID=39272 RepID=A0A8J2P3P2_9HEXA|nr:unnamed protein product [Allacma fusca]